MPPSSLILVGILTPLSGILGSLLWPKLQRKLDWSNLKILVLLVVLASVIPAYGCLGFFFKGRHTSDSPEALRVEVKFGGLTTPREMFGLAVIFGKSTSRWSIAIMYLTTSSMQALYMVLSKATLARFTQSSSHKAKKLGGMACSQLQTR
jgi:MFS-type transporter involved in bile tolerance (Atg22 family)